MLRRTSKGVQEVVHKMRLPAVIRLSRSFWDDARNGKAAEKMQLVLRQLKAMTAESPHHHTLPLCAIQGQDAERIAGVLLGKRKWHCASTLSHNDLSA